MSLSLNNLRNLLTLTIRQVDFTLVAKQPELVSKLRELTLGPRSGMNNELDWMLPAVEEGRSINCQILLAYRSKDLVGWALLSKEDTDFYFSGTGNSYQSIDGWLFEVFVSPDHRR
jgi:hypothetical protein